MSASENKEGIVKSTKSGLEPSSHVPADFKFAESFGGGFECLLFWRPPVWPFSLIRSLEQEDE
jgi:hypothetical protein